MRFRIFEGVLVALLVLPTFACRGPEATRTEESIQAQSTSTSDLEALYWARQDSARANFTTADVRFMTMMITHHVQALAMSALAPTHGASAPVQTLAARITDAAEVRLLASTVRDLGGESR